jgi:poly(hydroxyalkanoate) granule-associated protein
MATTKDLAKEARAGITENIRDIWLAGLGLFSTVEEEGEKLFNNFIERGREFEEKGESFEKRAKKQFDSATNLITDRATKITDDVSHKVSDMMPSFIGEKFRETLGMFGISTRNEVNQLNEKVNRLTEMVGTLSDKISSTPKTTTSTATKV